MLNGKLYRQGKITLQELRLQLYRAVEHGLPSSTAEIKHWLYASCSLTPQKLADEHSRRRWGTTDGRTLSSNSEAAAVRFFSRSALPSHNGHPHAEFLGEPRGSARSFPNGWNKDRKIRRFSPSEVGCTTRRHTSHLLDWPWISVLLHISMSSKTEIPALLHPGAAPAQSPSPARPQAATSPHSSPLCWNVS